MLLSNDGYKSHSNNVLYKLEFFIYLIVFRMFDISKLNSFGLCSASTFTTAFASDVHRLNHAETFHGTVL